MYLLYPNRVTLAVSEKINKNSSVTCNLFVTRILQPPLSESAQSEHKYFTEKIRRIKKGSNTELESLNDSQVTVIK
jgi:hypothetical protein